MKRGLVLAVLLSVALVATGHAQNLKVGIVMGFSGPVAAMSPAIETGALLAADQARQAGFEVEVLSRDSATDPGVGRDAAKKLVEVDRVPAIVGALSSGVTLAVSSVTTASNVVQISPASTSPQITTLEDNDYLFRTCPSDALQGRVQGQLAANMGYQTASVLYVNNAYGKGLADNFKKSFEAAGGKVLEMVPYEQNKPSYRGEVDTALRGEPDVLNAISYIADGNKQLVAAIEQGYQGGYLFADGMRSKDVATGPAAKYLAGAVGTAPGSVTTGVTRQFEKDYLAYLERTGKEADPQAPFRREGYDAMATLILAAAAAGPGFSDMSPGDQGRAIREHLRQVANPDGERVGYNEFARAFELLSEGKAINYEGVSGPADFDDKGDIADPAFDLWMVKDDRIANVWTVQQ